MNARTEGCDHGRIDDFLNSDHVGLEDEQLMAHLSSCDSCREYLETQAADPDSWSNAAELLRPGEFDQAGAVEYSVATIGHQRIGRPTAIQTVLDSLSPSDDPHRLGRLGGHEVSGVVGAGGMGVVLKAVDPSLDRVVAIKVMAPHLANNTTARKRFSREAKAAAAVLHPNVIPIHCVSSDDKIPYLVMAYVRGGSLQRRLEQEGPLPAVEILRIGSQIAAGLAAAHEQGLVHRDIKPENILLDEGVERVTLTDFGLARAVDDASVTQDGTIAGTPQYMSPEQARGESVDQQSDLFSLGSVLYALCTGRPPFRAESSYGVMRRISDSAPTPIRELNPDIPEWLVSIIEKLMAKEKAERFDSASEVHELLEACLSHVQQPDAARLPSQLLGKVKPAVQPPKRWSFAAVALTGLLLAFIAAIVYYIQTNKATVRVEVFDESLAVEICGQTITMKDGNKKPFEIRAGEHKLLVRQVDSDFEFETDNFEIRRNGEVAIKAEVLDGEVVVTKNGMRIGAAGIPHQETTVRGWIDSPLTGKRRSLGDESRAGVEWFLRAMEAYSGPGEKPNGPPVAELTYKGAIRVSLYGTELPVDDSALASLKKRLDERPHLYHIDTVANSMTICNQVHIEKIAPLPIGESFTASVGNMPCDLILDVLTIPFAIGPAKRSSYATVDPRILLPHLGEQYGAGMLSKAVSWRLVDRSMGWPAGEDGERAAVEVAEVLQQQCLESPRHLSHGWCLRDLRKLAENARSAKVTAILEAVESQIEGDPPRLKMKDNDQGAAADVKSSPDIAALPTEARIAIATLQLEVLQQVLNLYKLDHGAYPSTREGLKALVQRPADEDRAKNRDGPYMTELPTDRWGNEFEYAFPGTRGGDPTKPDIWSRGPDGKENTDDDVGNWSSD